MRATPFVGGFRSLASVIAASCVYAQAAGALTLTFAPKKDNTLYQSATGNISNGAGQHFFAGTTATGSIRRGVIAFDVAQSIPPGTVVDSVVVVLNMSRNLGGPFQVAFHRLVADWGQAGSDAPLEEGGGTPAELGDATWVHRFFNTQSWTTIGGDFAPSPSAVTNVGNVGVYSWSSPTMLADVKSWVDNPASNFGWLLRSDESTTSTSKRFDSSENPDLQVRPQLRVIFHDPTDTVTGTSAGLRLLPTRPNPFRLGATIAYEMARAGRVEMHVHDVRGRVLRTLVAESHGPGLHRLTWEGRDDAGRELGAGSYFLVLQVSGERVVERLVLVR